MSPVGPSGGAAGGRVSDLSILMADIFQQQEEEELYPDVEVRIISLWNNVFKIN